MDLQAQNQNTFDSANRPVNSQEKLLTQSELTPENMPPQDETFAVLSAIPRNI